MKVKYAHLDHLNLNVVEPLWLKLRDHHASVSERFSEQISMNTFQKRSKNLLNKVGKGKIFIILAINETTNENIGYCINSVTEEGEGEIDSIFILPNYREKGIGKSLMDQSLKWFKLQNVININIVVLFGNENALKFYEKYGFYPRTYVFSRLINR